jgi:Tfp pilus assembly protein PilF
MSRSPMIHPAELDDLDRLAGVEMTWDRYQDVRDRWHALREERLALEVRLAQEAAERVLAQRYQAKLAQWTLVVVSCLIAAFAFWVNR